MARICDRGTSLDTGASRATALDRAAGDVLALLAALGDVEVRAGHVAAVVGLADATPALEALQARHLVEGDGDAYRPTDPAGLPHLGRAERDAWMQKVVEHLVDWLGRPEGQEPRQVVGDLELVLAGLDWAAAASNRRRLALRLVRAVDGPLALSGRWGTWETVLGHGLDAARALGDRGGEAWALHQLGTRALGLGDATTANRHLTSALGLRERLGDRSGADVSRRNLRLAERLAKAS